MSKTQTIQKPNQNLKSQPETHFVAIDVETANYDVGSICQIGIAEYDNGEMIQEWVSLINPQSYFDRGNVMIHGLQESDVKDAPILPEVEGRLRELMEGRVVVSHTHFDRSSLSAAFEKNGLRLIDCHWLDSARVARRTWEEVSKTGYNLKNVCTLIGYQFKHHDALEDAKAAGQIVLASMAKTGFDIPGLIDRCNKPIKVKQRKAPPREWTK